MEIKENCKNALDQFKEIAILVGDLDYKINQLRFDVTQLPGRKAMKTMYELLNNYNDERNLLRKSLEEKASNLLKCQCNKEKSEINYYFPEVQPSGYTVVRDLREVERGSDNIKRLNNDLQIEKEKKIFSHPERIIAEINSEKEALEANKKDAEAQLNAWLDEECKTS